MSVCKTLFSPVFLGEGLRDQVVGLESPLALAEQVVAQHGDRASALWKGYLTRTLAAPETASPPTVEVGGTYAPSPAPTPAPTPTPTPPTPAPTSRRALALAVTAAVDIWLGRFWLRKFGWTNVWWLWSAAQRDLVTETRAPCLLRAAPTPPTPAPTPAPTAVPTRDPTPAPTPPTPAPTSPLLSISVLWSMVASD